MKEQEKDLEEKRKRLQSLQKENEDEKVEMEGGEAEVREIKTVEEWRSIIAENSERLVVMDFYAVWCGPCKAMAPAFKSWASEYPTALFCKVDVDKNRPTMEAAQIKAMPTFKFYKGGVEIESVRGANRAKVKELLETHKTDEPI